MDQLCKYCQNPENKQENPCLVCENCNEIIHKNCLKRPGTPGDLLGDVFFDFVCSECSPNNIETLTRNKMSWVNCIIIVLHHLNEQSYGMSKHGFFHWRTHISSFVDRHWMIFFGNHIKKKKNWMGTLSGMLSHYNTIFFQSGSVVLGESGWWKLLHKFSPAVADHINQEMNAAKQKERKRNADGLSDMDLFEQKVSQLGYGHLVNENPDMSLITFSEAESDVRKKPKLDVDEFIGNTSTIPNNENDRTPPFKDDFTIANFLTNKDDSFSDVDNIFEDFEEISDIRTAFMQSDTSSMYSFQPSSVGNYDSDSRSRSPFNYPQLDAMSDESTDSKTDMKAKKKVELSKQRRQSNIKESLLQDTETEPNEFSLFSTQKNSLDLPWVSKAMTTETNEKTQLVPLNQYEEIQLLKNVDRLLQTEDGSEKYYQMKRFRAKLVVRKALRSKHKPVFDFDKIVKKVSGFHTPNQNIDHQIADRVLDRFQAMYLLDNLSGTTTLSYASHGTRLAGPLEPTTFQSPYSGRILKPYIRRDFESTPLWLNVLEELQRKVHKNDKNYVCQPRAPIDYCYLRPQHVAAINSLCAQYFWPGVDISEALQYPEFSCVVLYKKLIIGFAFLVPDVGYNVAYISFIFTRPEWRKSKIATFMLYHLLQTCSGKDVTLHVSPTNTAVFLYQKFGFKVEELIQDFYDKYYEVDSKECKHALFLRLSR